MNRVAIVGCSGGGKSTLSRALGARLGLPIVHLDVIFWRPGWIEGDPREVLADVEAAVAEDRWITEGNFDRFSALRFQRADVIVWVDQPRLTCLRRAIWRGITGFGRDRPDLAPGCQEKIDLNFYAYIWNWNRQTRPKIEAALAAHAPQTPVLLLRNDDEVAAWLETLDRRSRERSLENCHADNPLT